MTSSEIIAVLPGTLTSSVHVQLQFVPAHGYTAVLAQHPRSAIKLPLSRKDVLLTAAQRQAWLEQCMQCGTVLPFGMDSMIDQADVPALIAANRPLLDALASRFAGKVQFQVTVSWDPQGVLSKFRNSPELSGLFGEVSIAPDKLSLSVKALSERLQNQILHLLEKVASEVLQLPVTDDMLTNSVVLVETSRLAELDQTIEAIDAIWTEGLRIKQIGPAPAASFASLAPRKITARDIEIALETIGSRPHDTQQDIARARRDALLQSPLAAADIKRSAEIIDAAFRVGTNNQAFFLCTAISDGQAAFVTQRKVA
ncbi:GvpL/GvpF family gas vesicle protein [Yoonia algicola]|uniref:GvpL/GvpF family gas vesicle protein n=1 Tax=Yoonia algicola TaxID=3137368 RepID=A0AAN0M3P2_9RHOB